MEAISSDLPAKKSSLGGLLNKLKAPFAFVPLLGWFFGTLVAVVIERLWGAQLAEALGMAGVPSLFGFLIILKEPALIPSTFLYLLLIYVLPITIIARLSAPLANGLAAKLLELRLWFSVVVHLGLLYLILHIWAGAGASDYRTLILRLTLISIMITLSLNVINGYMGEFSCSHPGFIALGAYGASVFTLIMFEDDRVFGPPLLPPALGPFMFPVALIAGGLIASLGAIVVAIPSFRTRGDYLAIISLAFMFMVKSLFENLEIFGGARGLGGQPDWAGLPAVFVWAAICVWIINNFVRSTLGKALNAVRDDEMAANAMTVNTRRTKMTAFLFAAFWAGTAGGLFAHVLRYVNPGMFGLQNLAEVLAMLYFGGLNSVIGSIVGAVSFNVLSEALRPLEIYKWIIIPLLVILVMIFRPRGLMSFKELDIKEMIKPKERVEEKEHAVTSR